MIFWSSVECKTISAPSLMIHKKGVLTRPTGKSELGSWLLYHKAKSYILDIAKICRKHETKSIQPFNWQPKINK